MLIFSMSVSVDGFIADREGAFGWTAPSDGTADPMFPLEHHILVQNSAMASAAGVTRLGLS